MTFPGVLLFIVIILLVVIAYSIAINLLQPKSGGNSGKNILIFGVPNEEQGAWFNYFINESNEYQDAEFSTADTMCLEDSSMTKCYKIDFNNLDDLRKLPDNTFTTIMFDWSTSKFLEWETEHVQEIKKKLTEFGELLIPNPIGMTIIVDNPTNNEPQNDNKIIRYIELKYPYNNKQLLTDIAHQKNIKFLDRIFENAVIMEDGKYPYPNQEKQSVQIQEMKNMKYYKMLKI